MSIFFARGIILTQFFALQFLQISRQLAARNSRLRLNDFRSLQSTNPSVPNCTQQFPLLSAEIPKSHQLILSMDELFIIMDELYLIQVGHKRIHFHYGLDERAAV